jgi:hypothetical protein
MMRVLQAIALVAVIVTLGGLCSGGWYERHLLHDTLWNIRAASWNLSETSRIVKENSVATSTEEKKILGEVSLFISTTNVQWYGKSGHGGLIPQMRTLVEKAQPVMDNLTLATQHLDGAIQSLNALIQNGDVTLQQLQASEKQILKLIADIDTQVTDPAIHELLAKFSEAVTSGAEGMKQLAAIATDGREIADKARETYLKPVNLWWWLVKELLPLAGSAAQVVK